MRVKVPPSVGISAIAGLVILEAIALWKGVDGAYLSVVVAFIAGIAGVALQKKE